jgi:hypothetical protein
MSNSIDKHNFRELYHNQLQSLDGVNDSNRVV